MHSSINIHDASSVAITAFNHGDTPSLTIRTAASNGGTSELTLFFTSAEELKQMATAVHSAVVLQGDKPIAHA